MKHNLVNKMCKDIFRVAWVVEQQSEGNHAENGLLFHEPRMVSQATLGISRPMLVHRLRRWPNINLTLVQYVVFYRGDTP